MFPVIVICNIHINIHSPPITDEILSSHPPSHCAHCGAHNANHCPFSFILTLTLLSSWFLLSSQCHHSSLTCSQSQYFLLLTILPTGHLTTYYLLLLSSLHCSCPHHNCICTIVFSSLFCSRSYSYSCPLLCSPLSFSLSSSSVTTTKLMSLLPLLPLPLCHCHCHCPNTYHCPSHSHCPSISFTLTKWGLRTEDRGQVGRSITTVSSMKLVRDSGDNEDSPRRERQDEVVGWDLLQWKLRIVGVGPAAGFAVLVMQELCSTVFLFPRPQYRKYHGTLKVRKKVHVRSYIHSMYDPK